MAGVSFLKREACHLIFWDFAEKKQKKNLENDGK